MHYVENDLLEQLKDRTTIMLTKHPEEFDKRIIDLIREVNAIPGIATTFSCSGHTPEEQKQKYVESRARYNQFYHHDANVEFVDFQVNVKENSHIIFAASKEGQPFIDAILKYLMEQDNFERMAFQPDLTLLRLIVPLGDINFYPAWKFSIAFNAEQEEDPNAVIERFQEVLKVYKTLVAEVDKPIITGRQQGTVIIENGNISAIKLLAYISNLRPENDSMVYHLPTDRLTEANMSKVMAPLEVIDFKDQKARVICLRDLNDLMHFIGVRGDGIFVTFNRITSTIVFDIDPINQQALDLLRIIQPHLFK